MLRNKGVVVQIDMASVNVAFTCQRYYAQVLMG